MSNTKFRLAGVLASALLTLGACARADYPPAPQTTTASPASSPATVRVVGPLTPDGAQALGRMNDQLRAYVDLHLSIERSLPALSTAATPAQIDDNQREFERRIRQARSTAQPGDIFTAEARPVIVRLLAAVFDGPDGRQLLAAIMDENLADPVRLKLTVNSRYPDNVPLTTVPPQVLQTLPKLMENLEYRFLGDWLILLDTHAHVIADFIDGALPK